MNRSDSERIAATLENIGYKKTLKIDKADLIIVNMCSVRQSAVDRVYGLRQKFQKLKTKLPTTHYPLRTILTGCILRKDKRKFAEYFDFILNIKNLSNWPKYFSTTYGDRAKLKKENYLEITPKYSYFPVVYVPVSTGCNNLCAYCVVPYTRESLTLRPAQDIIKEVKKLVKKGYKEIWLLGQNVNDYQSKLKSQNSNLKTTTQNSKLINFAKLLEMINDITGDFWIRFTSPNPANFSDELIDIMAKSKKITPYLNLPIQSGDDEILKKMNRPYTIKQYKNLVKKIRKKIPDITLSTDIIVGFPGETKKQFENTAKLLKEIKFDMAYIAQYSSRPGTTAAKMDDNVLQKEKKRRERALTEILEKTALEKNKRYIGKTVKVLPLEWKKKFLLGKSFHYKSLKIFGSKEVLGKFIKVEIIDALPWGLLGKQAV
jgi:tRNA-2-methylthio-N6-dimethylallyladenosine synthase